MRVGNLTTKRDYTDVRDVAKAYSALITMQNLKNQIYNVCSGKPRSGEEVLEALISVVGKPVEVIADKELFRPSDAPVLYGDNQRLTSDTGWVPSTEFKQTITDFVASKTSP